MYKKSIRIQIENTFHELICMILSKSCVTWGMKEGLLEGTLAMDWKIEEGSGQSVMSRVTDGSQKG